jgi:uncharacterized protein
MSSALHTRWTAFAGEHCLASGDLFDVARSAKLTIDAGTSAPILIFNDSTSEQLEVDFRGTVDDVLRRIRQAAGEPAPASSSVAPRSPGRPKLGVVAREVTLLPRHWDWLSAQPGGASVALRKLVDAARRTNEGSDRVRLAREAAYKFMSAMAGNLPGFEEATRALFAGRRQRFIDLIEPWPVDVRQHAEKLAADAFPDSPAEEGREAMLVKS